MQVFLANDTSRSAHAGCKAVMRSLHAAIAAVPGLKICGTHSVGTREIDEIAFYAADAVLINGEGTIHHSGQHATYLLALIAEAKDAGKKVLLVNALFQQYECQSDDILADLALLTVREPRSAGFARRYGGKPRVLLDSAADPAFTEGGTATPLTHGWVIGGYIDSGLLKDPFKRIEGHRLNIHKSPFEDIIATLRAAELYLTGQHHGVYAAAIAGCPFIVTPSNSHKIESFVEWTGLPIPICMQQKEILPAAAFALRNPSIYVELQDFMKSQSVLTSAMLAEALG